MIADCAARVTLAAADSSASVRFVQQWRSWFWLPVLLRLELANETRCHGLSAARVTRVPFGPQAKKLDGFPGRAKLRISDCAWHHYQG